MSKPHINYVVARSHRGRQMRQAKGARLATPDEQIPADIREHNARIDAERVAKKLAKKEPK